MKEVSPKRELSNVLNEVEKPEASYDKAADKKPILVSESARAEADELARKRLEEQKGMADISFTGSPESAKRYLDMAERHMRAARNYEREANRIERAIQTGTLPKSKMSEVQRLRRKAEAEEKEAARLKRAAQNELRY